MDTKNIKVRASCVYGLFSPQSQSEPRLTIAGHNHIPKIKTSKKEAAKGIGADYVIR